MSRGRIAVSVMPLETRRNVLIAVARMADRLGYDAFFLPETWAHDITVLLAEVALKTERIGIGTGILGVWNRSPATIAMAASTLTELSHGRFALGLGASTPQLTEGLHDVVYTRPLARMRQTITQVRALLHGERVPLVVAKEARALKLNLPSAAGVTISLAALGDDAIRLAGELADSWLPFLYPWSRLAEGRARLCEGAARGGHPDRVPEIHPSVPVVVARDAQTAREGAAWFVAFYLVNMGTMYRHALVRHGFGGRWKRCSRPTRRSSRAACLPMLTSSSSSSSSSALPRKRAGASRAGTSPARPCRRCYCGRTRRRRRSPSPSRPSGPCSRTLSD